MATPIPKNHARFTLAEIFAATRGEVRGALEWDALAIAGISTDTRALEPGQAFVALAGERYDGHDHLARASERGAVLAIVERDVERREGLTTLRVTSTAAALGALAGVHLARWRAAGEKTVVALTGSAGKTTTKRAMAALFEAVFPERVLATAGNLNNLVGVPMTVFGLEDHHRALVLELGTNAPGEIGELTRTVRPDVALVTLIARAHSLGLGTLDAIEREKCAIFGELDDGAVALGNADDPRVVRGVGASRAGARLLYGTSDAADYRLVSRSLDGHQGSRLVVRRADGSELSFAVPLLGHAGALAATAALAVVERVAGRALAVEEIERALAPLAHEEHGPGRLEPRSCASGLVVLDDSYNANPASCRTSIDAARELAKALGRRLVLVLGEMRELGDASVAEHQELGAHAADSGAALVIAIGGDARHASERAQSRGTACEFAASTEAGANLATELVAAGDLVLVKGSRGVRTELVVESLLALHGRAACAAQPAAIGAS